MSDITYGAENITLPVKIIIFIVNCFKEHKLYVICSLAMDYFNFCDYRLNPSASTSAVCAEGHEVTNLVARDSSKRQKGFMVYHTINPPVDIYFNFMCKINISHIIIWPQVGSQKSSAFQVFTSPKNASSSNQPFVNVGTGFLQNEPGIIFYHTRQPSNYGNFVSRRLFSKNNSLSAVHALQIRIMRTHCSSVPALQKVEVWGLPSVSCPRELRLQVLALWTEKNEVVNFIKNEKKESPEENVMRSKAKSLTDSNLEIPEEFVDQITYEIMVLPYTLPCGKVIDRTTLEKHENHEANWGRRPSDPFTGKLYTDSSKPIFDVALKSRIDKFLIEHSDFDEIKKVPRTIGRRSLANEKRNCVGKSSLGITCVRNTSSKVVGSYSSSSSSSVAMKIGSSNRSVLGNREKPDVNSEEKTRKRIKLLDESSSNHLKQCTSEAKCLSNDCKKLNENRVIQSHEDVLNDSLDTALKNALSHLPSFTNFSGIVSVPENKCTECDEKEIIYILPCQHYLCRMCLTKKTKETCVCSLCNSAFATSDPKRYHP